IQAEARRHLPGVLNVKIDVACAELVEGVPEGLRECTVVFGAGGVISEVSREIRQTRIGVPAAAIEQLTEPVISGLEIRPKFQRVCAVSPRVVVYKLKPVLAGFRARVCLGGADVDSL